MKDYFTAFAMTPLIRTSLREVRNERRSNLNIQKIILLLYKQKKSKNNN